VVRVGKNAAVVVRRAGQVHHNALYNELQQETANGSFPPIVAVQSDRHAVVVFDWTNLFDFLPWRIQVGCLAVVVVTALFVLIWVRS
jgi:hypothetical protein